MIRISSALMAAASLLALGVQAQTAPPSGAGGAQPAPAPATNPTQPPNLPAPGATPSGRSTPPPSPAAPANPQQSDTTHVLTIDLAASPGVYPRDPGTYRLHFINKIPSGSYSPRTKIYAGSIAPPFDASLLSGAPKPLVTPTGACKTAVDDLNNRVDGAMCESQIAAIAQTYKSALTAVECDSAVIQDFGDTLAKKIEWQDTDPLPSLAAGDALEVTITRDTFLSTSTQASAACGREKVSVYNGDATHHLSVDSRDLGVWRFEFGKPEAQWLIYYGFNFATGGDENYFVKTNSGSNPTTYTITRSADRSGKSFSASVYFFRLPAETGFSDGRFLTGWRTKDAMGGLTAGLGFDLDNPTVFLGYGVGWGYNIILTAGVVMHKEKRLKGQYQPGDVVSENLTSDQLLDSTYKPRAYIGLAFRFGSNPFKTQDSGQSTKPSSTTPSTKDNK